MLADALPDEAHRALLLSLPPDNMDQLERQSVEEIIRWLEKLDDDYYAQLPTFAELCRVYGNPNGTVFVA